MKTQFIVAIAAVTSTLASTASAVVHYGGKTSEVGQTRFNYTISLPSSSITTGDFFTITDFGQMVVGTNQQPAGWTFSSQSTGPYPFYTDLSGFDSASVPNLTWTYTGSTPLTAAPGTFSIASFTSVTASRVFGQGDGDEATFTGSSGGSITVAAVPEPASLSIAAVAALGLLRRRR